MKIKRYPSLNSDQSKQKVLNEKKDMNQSEKLVNE